MLQANIPTQEVIENIIGQLEVLTAALAIISTKCPGKTDMDASIRSIYLESKSKPFLAGVNQRKTKLIGLIDKLNRRQYQSPRD